MLAKPNPHERDGDMNPIDVKIKTYRRWKRCRGQNIGRFEGGVREGFGLRSACEPCRARCGIDDKKPHRNIIAKKKIILMK